MRYFGALNQSEMGAPAADGTGDAIRAHAVNDPAPVAAKTHKFRGLYGAFSAKVARQGLVFAPRGYRGEFPAEEQPEVQRLDPWLRPRG